MISYIQWSFSNVTSCPLVLPSFLSETFWNSLEQIWNQLKIVDFFRIRRYCNEEPCRESSRQRAPRNTFESSRQRAPRNTFESSRQRAPRNTVESSRQRAPRNTFESSRQRAPRNTFESSRQRAPRNTFEIEIPHQDLRACGNA